MSEGISSLHLILERLYKEMMPLCSQLIGVARLIGGLAALLYICSRIWKHIAHAEPVDVYALLRPFAIGLCILLFPSLIDLLNGVLQPTVAGTSAMVVHSGRVMERQLDIMQDQATGLEVLNPISWIREMIRELLELVFQAAALCINTIRTFYLIVMAIIGPLVFAISIFDGFQHTITVWLARYINVFLWLPVANIFGAIIGRIQEQMLFSGISNMPGEISVNDAVYIIFMLIAIVGYCTVPSVANYIVNAGGGNALVQKITSLGSASIKAASGSMSLDSFGNGASRMSKPMSENGISNGYFKDKK
jgi:hypothetical protein